MDKIQAPSLAPAESKEDPRLQKAKRLAQSGKLRQAADIFRAILKSSPDDPDALHYYGIVMLQLDRPNKAMASIKKSLSIAPDNPHALNSLGNLLKLRGDNAGAEEAYTSALKVDPINAHCLNNLGSVQRNQGRSDVAMDSLREAVRIAPDLAEAHFNLANLYYADGQHYEALNSYNICFKLGGNWHDPVFYAKLMIATDYKDEAELMLNEYLKQNPNNEGARYQLSAIRGEKLTATSETYVTEHFNDFAATFDGVLKGLGYRAPEYVSKTVTDRLGSPFADKVILGLGCGTGLCGPLLAAYKSHMIGIDLSPEMLKRAEKLGCYDDLSMAELQEFLRKQEPASVDVIVCADTLVYLGALEKTMLGVRNVLKPDGIFVASVEKLEESEEDYVLGISGRFQHSRVYLERLASENDLSIGSIREEILRKEAGEPVQGLIVEFALA